MESPDEEVAAALAADVGESVRSEEEHELQPHHEPFAPWDDEEEAPEAAVPAAYTQNTGTAVSVPKEKAAAPWCTLRKEHLLPWDPKLTSSVH